MSDDDFTKQLQNACRAEGLEHVHLLLSSLVKLEFATPEETPSLVEQSFRSLHNLKGSAHAAEFYTVESVCHPMEDIMSAIKSNNLRINSALIDLLLEGVGLVESLLGEDDDSALLPAIEGILARLKAVLGVQAPADEAEPAAAKASSQESLEVKVAGPSSKDVAVPPAAGVQSMEAGAQPPAKAAPQAPRAGGEEKSHADAGKADEEKAAQEVLRIPAYKLDALLRQAEEMLSLKAMVRQNTLKLDEFRRGLETRAHVWSKSAPDIAEARRMIGIMLSVSSTPQEQMPWLTMTKALDALDALLNESPATARDLWRNLDDCANITANSVNDLLDEAKSLLMHPCSNLFNGIPVIVRQLSRQLGKQAEVTISGGDIELDRRILGELKDPLIHLIRNSIDHGIETPEERVSKGKPPKATLKIAAAQAERMVEIRLCDDGRGIDSAKVKASAVKQGILTAEEAAKLPAYEALRLIFKSAISTSATITEISGRGLGMAIVEEKIEQLGGSIELETEVGKGTTFILRLPLTIATFRSVLVEVAGKTLAVPTGNIERVVSMTENAVQAVDGTDTFVLEGGLVPLGSLQDILRLPASFKPRSEEGVLTVGVVRAGAEKVGFIVDEVLGEQEVLVKSLGPVFSGVSTVLGVTVLGSGQVVPILNIADMLRTYRERRGRSARVEPMSPAKDAEAAPAAGEGHKRRSAKSAKVLVVDDMVTARMLMRNILESAGFNVKTANNGAEAFALLQQEQFDIVVTDVEMPQMDGIALTSSIRADDRLNHMPVVIVTSMASREDRERGVNAGANAYFAKNSFDEANLLDVVWKLI
ncbi:MAG TPA: hybrid sensor histidine kinase/response regulator [Candidatus Obscuribacterales bacterium]